MCEETVVLYREETGDLGTQDRMETVPLGMCL